MNRRIFISILLLFLCKVTFAQNATVTSKQLDEKEINTIFTASIKEQLQIDYAIYRIYEFNDKAGKHFIVMTRNKIACEERAACFDRIKASCYTYKAGVFNLQWTVKDAILPSKDEYSISHWTKYFEIADYDQDGRVDPILIYGTFAPNDAMDGRIRIRMYYQGKEIVIRHQNAISDYDRKTQVDKAFYTLPIKMQQRVKHIMEQITENDHGLFPSGWEKAMEHKKTKFDES
ncbi:M949_RS01915 family surface polysaccharide biosynthesis protein [Lacinutrix sp. MEBiC02595]